MKHLGKIESATFGRGGYQDAMFGLSVSIKIGDSGHVGDFKGQWWKYPGERAQYSEEQWRNAFTDRMLEVKEIMEQAKVDDITKLAGIPVEVELDGNRLVSWRVLEEVL